MSLLARLSIVGAIPPEGPLQEADLLRQSRAERTLPIVSRNLGRPCPEERRILGRQLLARAQADEILRRFEALPLKGLHLAHHVYPSPGLRDMGDLDLLVRPEDVPGADAELCRLGYTREGAPEGRPGPYLNSAVYWREGAFPVHLHWRLVNGTLPHFMVRIDEDEVRREARGGLMAPHHLVVSLCEHALKHSYDTLIHLTDIELAARGIDWPQVAETARRWRLERAVGFALVLLRDLAGIRSPGLDAFRPLALGWEGTALIRLARRSRRNGLSALGYLALTSGWRAKLRFVREALAPAEREAAGFRSRTFGRRLGRAVATFFRPEPS